eukprot:gene8297-15176_t
MWRQDGREESFDLGRWPFPGKKSKAGPSKMAAAGFYYTGGEDGDAVTCFMCAKDLDGWEEGDDPMAEHEKHCPACPWMNLNLEENRFKTFFHWPHKKKYTYKAKEFARAGFVHVPTADSNDMVKCVACDKHLDGWEADDNPLDFHVANCSFVAALKKQQEGATKKATKKESAAAAPATSSRPTRGSRRRLTRASIAAVEDEDALETVEVAADGGNDVTEKNVSAAAEPEPEPEPEADPDATPVKTKPAKKPAKAAKSHKGAKKEQFESTEAEVEVREPQAGDADADESGAMDEEATPVAVATSKKKVTKAALSKLQVASPTPDITVDQHLKNVFEAEQQALTFSCEERMRQFREEASRMREVIRHLGDATNVA